MQEQTYDPVVDVAELPRWRLTSPLRAPDPGLALVLVRESGPSLTVRSGEDIPSARYGTYSSVFTVDLGEHRLILDVALLSRDPAFSFTGRIDLICRVIDPAEIVARGIRDMSGALYGHLRRTLREVARDYDIAEFHQAEQALNAVLAGFRGDDAVRLRSIHIELLVDEDEIATSGRAFRDVLRESRLSTMRRQRHLDLLHGEGVDGLIAELMEREGPQAALAWIEKNEAEQRAIRHEVARLVLERGDGDREPFEQAELERAVLMEVLHGGGAVLGTGTGHGRLRGSLSRAVGPAEAHRVDEAPEARSVRGEIARDVAGAAPRRPISPDGPPDDEPLPPLPPRPSSAPPPAGGTPAPRVSRVRGTAKRPTSDPDREPR
ncbi:hypothetical protein ACU686_31840 [Yinghuangia aomiensis]